MTNKEIAHNLNKLGYLDDQGMPKIQNLKFLEKCDINGPEMHNLYRFAKRHTPQLFVPRYGMAAHVYEYNCKFLFDRYGEVKHFYPGSTDHKVIESDLKELLKQ